MDIIPFYNTVTYNTVTYNTVTYNTVTYNTVTYNTVTYNTYREFYVIIIKLNTIQLLTLQIFCNF